MASEKSVVDLQRRFGHRVAEVRLQRKLTQQQLAERSDVGVQFIQKLEIGDRAPSFETLAALSAALETEVRELFNWEDQKLAEPKLELEFVRLREVLRDVAPEDVKAIRALAESLGGRRGRRAVTRRKKRS